MLAVLGTTGTLGLGGCLTLDPTLSTPGLANSQVFKALTPANWAVQHLTVGVSFTSVATTKLGVRSLTVVAASGSAVWSDTVSPGESSIMASLPTAQTVTLVATDYDGRTVETLRVTVGGNTLV